MGSYTKGIILVIILLFLITFGIKNSHLVQLNYFNIPAIDVPLYGLAYISIIIGILIGMLVGISRRFSLRRTVKALERETRELEKKVTEGKKEDAEEST